MKFQSDLAFDARKIYFFGVLIALLYGLSPAISTFLFDTEILSLFSYEFYFIISATVFLFVSYPSNYRFKFRVEVDEISLLIGLLVFLIFFVTVQIAVYGDFTTAFIVAYTERAGAEFSGDIRFIFYPITTAFISLVLLFATHLYVRRDRINIINLTVLSAAIISISALGSRNLLLWSFSAVLALVITKLPYRHILSLVACIYLVAVLFAYARNNGLVAYLSGNIDQLYDQLSWEYFDPMIHEFGSSYRTFDLISAAPMGATQLENAPYGLLGSFFINQLPSFLKPSDFISFTDYISLVFAKSGEGIGSSPMTEAYLSNMRSLISLGIISAVAYWPAYYLRRWPMLSFFSYALVVAVSFNIWRIGSAEILKMFASNVVALIVLAKCLKFRVLHFGKAS